MEYEVEIRPGVSVVETIFNYVVNTFSEPSFLIYLGFALGIALLIIIIMVRNSVLLKYEEKFGHPNIIIMIILTVGFATVFAVLAYESIKLDKVMFWCYLIVLGLWLLWAVTLFFSRFERGSPLIFGTVFFLSVLYYSLLVVSRDIKYLSWCSICLLWSLYTLYYTFVISRHPWTPLIN